MPDLEFCIGVLKIEPNKLGCERKLSILDNTNHAFVVGAKDRTISIYVAPTPVHKAIVEQFDIENPVGGGRLYVSRNYLILDGVSGDYKCVPRRILNKLGDLVHKELQQRNIELKTRVGVFCEGSLNEYWDKLGIDS